jgi:long-chain acyl-CoA synthetase
VDRIWLKSYPKGVPADIDVNTYASVRDLFDQVIAQYGPRRAYTCMGSSITFAELDARSAAFGAFLQGRGLAKGARVALMMPNILQYPVPVRHVERAGGREHQPALHAARAEHQLTDSGAEVIVVVENFAHTLQEVIGKTRIKQVVVTSVGEFLGLKGLLVDFVLRRVKKMVPEWSLPGAIRLTAALAEGAQRKLELRAIGHEDIAFLVHGRHDRRCQRRDAAAPEHHRQPAAGPCLGETVPRRPAAGDHHSAAALSHLLAHRELPRVHDPRRGERPDYQSARHPRLRQGDG